MWKDEIVEEVRRVREELAAKFDHNITAIVENARRNQAASGRTVVSFSPKKRVRSATKRSVVVKT